MTKSKSHNAAYRLLVESRLTHLLEVSEIGISFDAIQSIIFDYPQNEVNACIVTFLALFGSSKTPLDEDALYSVIQDAWNYFPHRFLDGRCPADLMDQFG